MKKFFLLLLLLTVLAVAAATELQKRWQTPLQIPRAGLKFEVKTGDSLRSIARRLQSEGIYADAMLLIAYGRITGVDSQLKRGQYLVPPGILPEAFLQLLQGGEVLSYQVTIPEGLTLSQALTRLGEQSELVTELSGTDDARIVQLSTDYPSAEGLFLPETYRFVSGDSDWDIVQRAFAQMQQVLMEEWAQRMDNLPLETPYEALILASIIERETGVPRERAQIAGVFIRRLQKGIRLQTDPTIIYGLGADFDGNLRRSHLRDESSPYNTYRHHGLPPTPIALPGRAAIHAALHPDDGQTLFFVARGDGSHEFSITLAEHERAVRKYQLRRRSDYRSSPKKNQ
ncbi:MAG: endolytic transglycosylase MltG [Parahaliea sp.]